MPSKKYSFQASEEDLQIRLDKVLVQHFSEFSRNFLQKLFEEELVRVNGKVVKPRTILSLGQKVELVIPEPKKLELEAKNIPLDIIFENKDVLVINKPAGLVTHMGVGEVHINDSLVNAVLYHCKGELSGISGVMRPGIVHRLDKDTSGLMIVAKNDKSHKNLALQFKNHEVKKTYFALLAGHLSPKIGSIEAPIGRSNADRKEMAVVQLGRGKEAITNYEVLEYFKKSIAAEAHFTYVKVSLITGRTHQIRVHFSSIGFPLIGDQMYGREKLNNYFDQRFGFRRQFLHAGVISFVLPGSKKRVIFEAPLPKDLGNILKWMSA